MFPSKAAVLLALLALSAPLAAWQDRFDQWNAAGDIQVLQVDRPGPLAPSGALDSNGNRATGYFQDGLWGRKVEARVWGPLGWEGFSAALGTQTDLNAVSLADAYLQMDDAWGWQLRLGQERLPMAWEQQVGGARLVTIQRSLLFGFGNYGHTGNWGLGLLSERGWGLRADRSWNWHGGGMDAQVGGFDATGGDFNAAVFGQGRVALRQSWGPLALALGLGGLAGRASLLGAPSAYTPLGQAAGPPQQSGDAVGGKGALNLESLDAGADWGPLHGRAEAVLEHLCGWQRGGLEATEWLDLPVGQAQKAVFYGREEQAFTSRPDGLHRPQSLYRAITVGMSSPLAWGCSLKVEAVDFEDDDFQPFAGGRIYQAQLQMDF